MARDDTQGHQGQDHGRTHGAVDPSMATPEASSVRVTDDPTYTTRALGSDTWDDFAALAEANNGVWGGCWCMGFHPEGLDRGNASANRDAKRAHVERGTAHQMLVYADDGCVGWCQYGTVPELPNIKNRKAYAKNLGGLPDWRIGCIFTDKSHRGQGVARAARGHGEDGPPLRAGRRGVGGPDGPDRKSIDEEGLSMREYLNARRKAIAPAVAQLAAAGVFWAISGEINAPEISLGVSALVTALIVERTPNKEG